MEKSFRCILILTTLSLPVVAQHAGHGATEKTDRPDAMSLAMGPFAGMPPSREGSGTGWQPDATPVFGHHTMPGDWMMMAHYNVFLGYDHQSGPRGDEQFNSVNWFMLMAQRGLGLGRLTLRGMFSLEPWTTSAEGYPLLFQSGEAYHGEALVDRQHPHDFFMELSALYRHPLTEDTAAFLYLAPAGEPALGPTAFPHRASAMVNPSAPISHHWLDSTHIAFGVATVGISKDKWQLEGSWFNGREPDEDRWDIEAPHLDSYAGRLSYNPTPNWSLQVSHAFLASPEELHPDESVRRTTASVQYYRSLGGEAALATTLAWGLNDIEGQRTNAFLLEATWHTRGRMTVFGRAEYIEKTGEELDLRPEEDKFDLRQLTAGASYALRSGPKTAVAVGGALTYTFKPERLDAVYGDNPLGVWVFVRFSPAEKM